MLAGSGYDLESIASVVELAVKKRLMTWQHNYADAVAHIQEGYQIIYTKVEDDAYLPKSYVLRQGIPVKWVINVKALSLCNRQIVIPALAMAIGLEPGLQIIEFLPKQSGVIRWSCYMGMIPGTFIVKE